jgi:hypothetical protein
VLVRITKKQHLFKITYIAQKYSFGVWVFDINKFTGNNANKYMPEKRDLQGNEIQYIIIYIAIIYI